MLPSRRVRRSPGPRNAGRNLVRVEQLESRDNPVVTTQFLGSNFTLSQSFDVIAVSTKSDVSETFIATNPTAPGNLVVTTNNGVTNRQITGFSTDAGQTWTRIDLGKAEDGLSENGNDRFDGSTAADRFGNLHVVYQTRAGELVHAVSADAGASYTATLVTTDSSLDKPWIAIGPDAQDPAADAVVLTWSQSAGGRKILGTATTVTGPGAGSVNPFGPNVIVSSNTVQNANYAIPAVGPTGQIAVTWMEPPGGQNQANILFTADTDGLANGLTFPTARVAATSNAGGFDFNPASPDRSAYASPYLTYDRSNGPNKGRLYLAYAEEPVDESNNWQILVRRSDDNGKTFSAPVQASDKSTGPRFFQTPAVDPNTGFLWVGFYDSRNDKTGSTVEFHATVSLDGGLSFLPNLKVADGPTDQANGSTDGTGSDNDLGDYTGFAAFGGSGFGAWSDNFLVGSSLEIVTDRVVLKSDLGQRVTGTGSAGPDTYVVRLDESKTFVQVFENPTTSPPTGVPAMTVTLSALTELVIDGGAGDDALVIDGTNGNPLAGLKVTFTGGAGKDTIALAADADFTIAAGKVTIEGKNPTSVTLPGVEGVRVTGGKGFNVFTVTDFVGTLDIDGGAGFDTVRMTRDTNFTLTATALTTADGTTVNLTRVEAAELTGGPGANKFTLAGFTGLATLDGQAGPDTYSLDSNFPQVTVAESGADIGPDTLELTGTPGIDAFTVSKTGITFGVTTLPLGGGKIESFAIDGGDGNDSFVVDVGPGLFNGGTLKLTGGAGKNTLSVVGTPAVRIGQGSLVNSGAGAGSLVYDPDGSGGPLQGSPAGPDAMIVSFTGMEPIITTVPADRFDLRFGPGNDAVVIDKSAAVNGIETLGVLAAGQGARVGKAGALTVHGGAGEDKFTINLTNPAGLAGLVVYGFQSPAAGKATDDNAADLFELRAAVVPVALFGQGGDDAFTVGAAPGVAGGTDGVAALVTLDGGPGNNALTLSDAGAAGGNPDVRITSFGVTGLVGKAGDVPVSYSGISRLAVFGSNAAAPESFTVEGVNLPLDLNTGGGPDTVVVQNVSAPLTLDTGAGDDDVTLTDVAVAAGLTVAAGDGNNLVRAFRTAAPGGLTVVAGGGNDQVTVESLSGPLTVDAGGGNNDIRVTGLNTTGGVSVTAGAGDDRVELRGVTAAVVLSVGTGRNVIALTDVTVPGQFSFGAGPGDDFVVLANLTAPGGIAVATAGGDDDVTVTAARTVTSIDTGDGNDRVAVNTIEAPVTINTGAGDDEVEIGGPTLEAILIPPAVDGGPGIDRVTLNDSGNPRNTLYTITAAGVSRDGRPPFAFTSVEASGLLPGTGNNTFAIQGTPAGGVVLRDGPGNGTFVIAAGALNGPNTFDGGDGDDTLTANVGAGIPAGGLTFAGGNGTDTLTLIGRPGDDVLTFRLSKDGPATVSGLGGDAVTAEVEVVAIDGAGGRNTLTLLDGSDTVFGTPLTPDDGVVVTPTGVGAGGVRFGGTAPVVRYANFGGGLTVNGDPDGSGDADVLTVNGFSSSAAGGTADDGSDQFAVSDQDVVVTNRTLGEALRLTLGQTGGNPTFGTVFIRTGDEAGSVGDDIAVTPSTRVNLVIDAMGPGGTPGDKLTVRARGAREVEAVPAGPEFGPAQTRLTLIQSGLSVGYIGFETAPRANPNAVPLDGTPIFAVSSGPGVPAIIRVFDPISGALLIELRPYEDTFLGGVTVATADVTGDGVTDIVVGAGPGAGPRVQVIDGATFEVVQSFFAYEETFTGGVQVAAADVTGDGVADIILGTGLGGGPRVQVMDLRAGRIVQNYFAYEESFRNGVQVAAGDVNGDGLADVVAGAGRGGGPRVRVFSGLDGAVLFDFFAYDDAVRSGVNVGAGDIDADGFADVITGPGAGSGADVRAFSGATGGVLADINQAGFADPAAPTPGTRVATSDLDGDGIPDILTTPGPGAFPVLRGFRLVLPPEFDAPPTGVEVIREQAVFEDDFDSGVFVG